MSTVILMSKRRALRSSFVLALGIVEYEELVTLYVGTDLILGEQCNQPLTIHESYGRRIGACTFVLAPLLKLLVVMMSPCSCAPSEPRTCWTNRSLNIVLPALRLHCHLLSRTDLPPSCAVSADTPSSIQEMLLNQHGRPKAIIHMPE